MEYMIWWRFRGLGGCTTVYKSGQWDAKPAVTFADNELRARVYVNKLSRLLPRTGMASS